MRPVSLDHPLLVEPGDEGEALVERLGDDDPGYAHTDDVFTARQMLDHLSERERRILEPRSSSHPSAVMSQALRAA